MENRVKRLWKYKHQRQDLLFSPLMKTDEGRIKCGGQLTSVWHFLSSLIEQHQMSLARWSPYTAVLCLEDRHIFWERFSHPKLYSNFYWWTLHLFLVLYFLHFPIPPSFINTQSCETISLPPPPSCTLSLSLSLCICVTHFCVLL